MLRWTVPSEPDIAGYRVYAGTASRAYGQPVDVGLMASATLGGLVYYLYQNLQPGTPSYIAATAYNAAGIESDYSNELLFNFSTVTPPTADTGPNQTGTAGDLLTIGSVPVSGVSYFWQQMAGPPAALSNRTTSSAQFIPGTAGTYLFSLTAFDSHDVATRNWVTVTVTGSPLPCVGDCDGKGQVTVDETLTIVNIAFGNTPVGDCLPGDANNDGRITVDEILTAVNNALNGCPLAPEQGCLGSGGTVTTATCCASAGDFPDTCAIGACGCPSDASHEVRLCTCANGCFNGSACVGQ